MQTPTMKTTVPKCINLARYSETLFAKLPGNATLAALLAAMSGAREALAKAQHAYFEAVSEIVHARAEVRWADYVADKGVRSTARRAEDTDGRKGGKIASFLFPDGITPIIKPVGATQVQAMRNLEGKLEAVAGDWKDADAEKATINKLRVDYEAALEKRGEARQKASNLKALRDAAKEDFLDVYAEATARVKAEFPRDRQTQDLFFDAVVSDEPASEDGTDEDDVSAAGAAGEGASKPG